MSDKDNPTGHSAPGIRVDLQHILSGIFVGVVLLLIVPMSPTVLDVLLCVNIAIALIVMLMSIAIGQPLKFAVFPTMLLMATLFRLLLDVSATRMILLHGDALSPEGITMGAGRVIPACGQIFIRGNVLEGIVIFLILVIIQFRVMTRGAERIAQVAARFTLDALPMKIGAIEQELSAGSIDFAAARLRRLKVECEGDFFGAMSGATTFVKGGAMAGVVAMIVNLVGGVILGLAFHHLGAAEAFSTYALLSIGYGLATTVPAVLMSTSMAMLVKRAASAGPCS